MNLFAIDLDVKAAVDYNVVGDDWGLWFKAGVEFCKAIT